MIELLRALLSVFSIFHCTNSLSLTKSTEPVEIHIYKRKIELEKTDTGCWEDVKPKYSLWTRKEEEGVRLSHLVVLIHGFHSWPAVWAEELAEVILRGDRDRKNLGV